MKRITSVVFSVLLVFSGIAYAGLDDGLVAHYPFNGNSNDEIGTNHGNVSGAMLTEDRFGNPDSAYYFDGIDDVITVQSSASINFGTSDFSLTTWMRTSVQGDSRIVSKRDTTLPSASGYTLGLSVLSSASAGIAGTPNPKIIISGETFICDGLWHFIVFVADRDGNGALYIDGEPDGLPVAISSEIGSVNNDLPLYIGMHGGDGAFYAGEIDDIRLYNRVISEDEIQELFLLLPQIPPDISGCIKIQGSPLACKIIILRQWREPTQVTWTDDEGCYKFETINLDRRFSIRIISGPAD